MKHKLPLAGNGETQLTGRNMGTGAGKGYASPW